MHIFLYIYCLIYSQIQLEKMYEAAATYLEDFTDYGNFDTTNWRVFSETNPMKIK